MKQGHFISFSVALQHQALLANCGLRKVSRKLALEN